MAENRGNPSGSKSNLPNTRPDGITRPNNRNSDKDSHDTYKPIDTKTLKEMRTVYNGLTKFAVELGGNLKDFNEVIEKSANTLVSTRQKLDKTAKEYDAEVAEMKKHYFGANKKIVDDYEKFVEEKKQLMEKEFEETRKEERKNIIKHSFRSEKEKNSVKLLDSKYIKHNFKNLINNEYQSELEKLNTSALEMFGENFKANSQYQTALLELGKEYTKKAIKESFKDTTSRNQVKLLDNKYAKKDKFGELNNEYYNQLEKLKISAIDTFDNGLDNENYKSALLTLQNDFTKQFNDLKKEELITNYQGLITVGSSVKDGIKTTFEENEKSLRGILGPLNLFIEPFSKFFGKGLSALFSGIKKKKPNANDVAKTGAFGMGSLFIVDSLYKIFGKDNAKENKQSKLDKIKDIFGKGGGAMALMGKGKLSGVLTKILPKAGPVMIAIAIIKMVIDGINGMLKSKEWGTSKMSGFLGGFLGGVSKGIVGAFKNMGKWALMGAGIGALIPPHIPTAIAGGIIGAVIGGILGAIGGKNLAKGFDKLGGFMKTMFANMWEALKDLFNVNKFIAIFKSDESLGKKIGKAIGLWIVTMVEMIPRLMKKLFSGASNLVSNVIERSGKIKDAIGNLGISLMNGISNGFNKAKDFAKNTWEGIKGFGGDIWEGLKESELANFVKNIFNSLNEGVSKFFNENPVGKWMSSLLDSIRKGLNVIGDYFLYIRDSWDWSSPLESIKNVFGGFTADKKTGLSKFDVWKSEQIDDAIIRTDGSIIKTNPQDTLVALKNIPLSMEQVRNDTTKNLNTSLSNLGNDKTLEKKLTTIIDVLSKILDKDVQVNLPPQTRGDLDMIMSGGMI